MPRFTSADVARLQSALSVLLRPLDFPDTDAWGDTAGVALCDLLGADGISLLLPANASTGGASRAARWRAVGRSDSEFDVYERQFGVHDRASERMLSLGLRVAHTWMLWKPDELERSAVYAEYHVPARIHDALGLRVRSPEGPLAGICLHRERPHRREVPVHGVEMLRAVEPAFQVGLAAWYRLGAQRAELARMLDAIPDAVFLFDAAGTLLHANTEASRVASAHPDGERVGAEAQSVAWSLGALARRAGGARGEPNRGGSSAAPATPRPVRHVPMTTGPCIVLRGSLVTEGLLGRDVGVLVTAETLPVQAPPSDEALRRRYGLTARELEVARLVADGLSNVEIAHRLAVSFFTARNHVERVLAKLRVPNRARVGALLRAGAGPQERRAPA